MDSEHKVRNFVTADCLCIFQMFKLTFRPDFFYNIDFAMYSVQPVKICLKNINFKGLKWTRTQKIQSFVTADCFGIFADFKSTF